MRRAALVLPAIALLAGCSKASDVAPWSAAFSIENSSIAPSVAVGPQGDVAIAGQYTNGVAFGGAALPDHGDQNTTLAVLDPEGAFRFAFTPDDLGASSAEGVAFESNGDVVICGDFTGTLPAPGGSIQALSQDTYVAGFDLTGKNLWTRHFSADLGGPSGAGTSRPSALAASPDGGLVLAGWFTGTFGVGGPPLDTDSPEGVTFVAKLDAEGRYEWQIGFGGSAHQPTALAVDGAGNVVVAGSSQGELVVDGHTFKGGSAAGLPFLVGISPEGAPRWVAQIGGGIANITGIGVDGAGDVFAGGFFSGTMIVGSRVLTAVGSADAFVIELSPEGKPLWVDQFGDAAMMINAIAVTGGGHALVTGNYNGEPAIGGFRLPPGLGTMFLVELGRDGVPVANAFHKRFPNGTVGTGVAVTPDGGILLAGDTVGFADLGSGRIGVHDFATSFVARLAPLLPSK
jgi:hypothetical protein